MQPGQVLADRYRIDRSLGRGGMALVFSASDERLRRQVALKILPPALTEDPAATDRLIREARTNAALNHPNVVAVLDVIEEPGTTGIVMEQVTGPSLQSLLDQGRLELPMVARVMKDVCQGVAEAHARGVIHRDIKPANILLAESGVAKVADFGVAAVLDETQATGTIRASIPYVAPEQARGEPADSRSDVYGLGCVFYELLVGHPPYQGTRMEVLLRHLHAPPPRPTEQRPELPDGVNAVVADAMAKDPGKRLATASELAARIEALDLAGARAPPHDATAIPPPVAAVNGSAATDVIAAPHPRGSRWLETSRWRTPARLASLAGLVLPMFAIVALAWPDATPANRPSDLQATRLVPEPSTIEEGVAALEAAVETAPSDRLSAAGRETLASRVDGLQFALAQSPDAERVEDARVQLDAMSAEISDLLAAGEINPTLAEDLQRLTDQILALLPTPPADDEGSEGGGPPDERDGPADEHGGPPDDRGGPPDGRGGPPDGRGGPPGGRG